MWSELDDDPIISIADPLDSRSFGVSWMRRVRAESAGGGFRERTARWAAGPAHRFRFAPQADDAGPKTAQSGNEDMP